MDSIELETEKKSDTDYQYQQMLKGKSFQLWIDTPDQEQDE